MRKREGERETSRFEFVQCSFLLCTFFGIYSLLFHLSFTHTHTHTHARMHTHTHTHTRYQNLREIQLHDLTTHLDIFEDHKEQDFEEMLHRLQDIRIEFKYPLT